MLIKIHLSEPINPTIDPQILPRSTDIAMRSVRNLPNAFPNVEDAVVDYQNSIFAIVSSIAVEYSRMFQEDEESKNGASMTGPTSQALKST